MSHAGVGYRELRASHILALGLAVGGISYTDAGV